MQLAPLKRISSIGSGESAADMGHRPVSQQINRMCKLPTIGALHAARPVSASAGTFTYRLRLRRGLRGGTPALSPQPAPPGQSAAELGPLCGRPPASIGTIMSFGPAIQHPLPANCWLHPHLTLQTPENRPSSGQAKRPLWMLPWRPSGVQHFGML